MAMSDDLDELVKLSLAKAITSGQLEDFNKAAMIAKAIAETSKADADIANAKAQMRLEGLKSFATFMVPIVSLLTIGFTIYIQYLQLQESQRLNEATQWRDFLASAKTSANSVQSDPTFAPRLRSFFTSVTYRDQAISISKRMMGSVANAAGFRDLFGVTFPAIDTATIADVVDVGRSLNANLGTTYSECATFTENLEDSLKAKIPKIPQIAGICSPTISEKTIRGFGLSAQESEKLSELRRNVQAFELENGFFSEKIAEFIRVHYAVGASFPSGSISLSKLWIISADLSNVDFSNLDVSDTIIDQGILTGAKLTPRKYGSAMDFRFTAWWESRAIDQTVLNELIENQFPYVQELEVFRDNKDYDLAYYAKRISELCVPMRPNCQLAALKFGKKATAPGVTNAR
jgi:hypothetical protein